LRRRISRSPRDLDVAVQVERRISHLDYQQRLSGGRVGTAIAIGAALEEGQVRFGLRSHSQPNRTLHADLHGVGEGKSQESSEAVHARGVAGSDGHLLDHLPVEQLHALVRAQDAATRLRACQDG
jgi:hypothetical protein